MRPIGLRGKLEAKYQPGETAGPLKFIDEYIKEHFSVLPVSYRVPGHVDNWGMLGNGPDPTLTVNSGQPVGDCTFAGRQHDRMAKAAAFDEVEQWETSNELVDEYLAYTNGQDSGACIADLLATWYHNNIILGYAPCDITNRSQLHSALIHFNGLYTGVALPQAAENQFANGQPWAITGDPQQDNPIGGHCIVQIAYGPNTDLFVTWGAVQPATVAWSHKYRDEAWVIITHEDENVDLAQLRADIEQLHGQG